MNESTTKRNEILLTGFVFGILLTLGLSSFFVLRKAEAQSTPIESMASPQTLEIDIQSDPNANDDSLIVETGPAITLPQVEDEPEAESPLTAACIPGETEYQTASVVDVIDGDRLRVSIDGEISTVKYIGIVATPEASEATLTVNLALIGQIVTLAKDVSEVDGDGNLLRYVFTEDAFINQYFLENGLATALISPPDGSCAEDFQAAEAQARNQEVGAWERLKPEQWRDWPIIPAMSENAVEIYKRFLGVSADPQSFSIVGDCLSLPERLFRKIGSSSFKLPAEYAYLQSTVEQFRSVWARQSVTVGSGFVPASQFSSYFADPKRCNSPETPINCEFRINQPSIVFISIGTDQIPGTEEEFEYYMREIIEFIIDKGALPIISTKADSIEEDFPLNAIMAKLAYEYDVPLWNFWAAVQDLPNGGVNPATRFNLTAQAKEIRRLSALQVLDVVLSTAQE